MSANVSEETLQAIQQVLDGDKEAFAEIIDGYHHHVRAALASYCRSADEVEEYAHLAFVEAYVRLEEYDPQRGPFHWWLIAIARSRLLDELRRRKAQGRRELRYVERLAARSSPAEHLEKQHAALEGCMSELSPGDERLVRARYQQEQTSDTIGASIGKSAVAVRRALQRVRERLRQCMERRLGSEAEAAT